MTDKLLTDFTYWYKDGEMAQNGPAGRPMTLSDLVEVIESLGGEVRTAVPHGVPTYALFIQGPGRYLVIPLPGATE